MSNAGSDNTDEPSSVRTWIVLGGLLLFVCGGLALAIFLLPILTGLFFPPAPPVPIGAALMSHSQQAHGEGDWKYSVANSACDVVPFYAAIGTCDALIDCSAETTPATNAIVAVCEGTQNFSIFAARWQAIVSVDSSDANQSRVEISSRVLWTGAVIPR